MAIVVVSDQHLGIETADKAAFLRFLGQLQSDASVTDLVLLGDVVDMWRRDASGVFLENKDVLDQIILLQKKMRVYYIAGNHDFHVLKLQGRGYPVTFLKNLTLQQDGTTYKFLHGWEFDEMQREHFMESLCHAMSDEKGDRDTHIWAALTRDKGDLKYVFTMIVNRAQHPTNDRDAAARPSGEAQGDPGWGRKEGLRNGAAWRGPHLRAYSPAVREQGRECRKHGLVDHDRPNPQHLRAFGRGQTKTLRLRRRRDQGEGGPMRGLQTFPEMTRAFTENGLRPRTV